MQKETFFTFVILSSHFAIKCFNGNRALSHEFLNSIDDPRNSAHHCTITHIHVALCDGTNSALRRNTIRQSIRKSLLVASSDDKQLSSFPIFLTKLSVESNKAEKCCSLKLLIWTYCWRSKAMLFMIPYVTNHRSSKAWYRRNVLCTSNCCIH